MACSRRPSKFALIVQSKCCHWKHWNALLCNGMYGPAYLYFVVPSACGIQLAKFVGATIMVQLLLLLLLLLLCSVYLVRRLATLPSCMWSASCSRCLHQSRLPTPTWATSWWRCCVVAARSLRHSR